MIREITHTEPPIWSTAGLTTLIGADAQIWQWIVVREPSRMFLYGAATRALTVSGVRLPSENAGGLVRIVAVGCAAGITVQLGGSMLAGAADP
jgi:hypothetical protein